MWLKRWFAVVEPQQMGLYMVCVTVVSGRLSHEPDHPPSPRQVLHRQRTRPCLTQLIAERGDEKQ